jgi:hypothetical protein
VSHVLQIFLLNIYKFANYCAGVSGQFRSGLAMQCASDVSFCQFTRMDLGNILFISPNFET